MKISTFVWWLSTFSCSFRQLVLPIFDDYSTYFTVMLFYYLGLMF